MIYSNHFEGPGIPTVAGRAHGPASRSRRFLPQGFVQGFRSSVDGDGRWIRGGVECAVSASSGPSVTIAFALFARLGGGWTNVGRQPRS